MKKGKMRGLIQIVARMLPDLKIESRGPRVWKQGNKLLDLEEIDDLRGDVGKKE